MIEEIQTGVPGVRHVRGTLQECMDQLNAAPPSKTPVLDRVFEMVKQAMIREAEQDGGPSLNTTAELNVDVTNDPVLRRVLEVKGGKLNIVLRMIPIPVDSDISQQMAELRAMAGVKLPTEAQG